MNNAFVSALLVEDEPNLAVALEVALRKLRISVERVSTLSEARKSALPELIVLDRALPDGDGIEFCDELRGNGFEGMILVLTARTALEDRIEGLNTGADDYLGKPFSWEELEARIRALARRKREMSGASVYPTIWQRDSGRRRVFGPKGWVTLTKIEFKLASILISAKGEIVSREELLKDVWGFRFLPKTRTVDYFMGRLRKHFEVTPEEPRHFLTARGEGYRFEP